MKKLFLLLALAGVMVACGDKKENKKDEAAKANTEKVDENKEGEDAKANNESVVKTDPVDALVKKAVEAVKAKDEAAIESIDAEYEKLSEEDKAKFEDAFEKELMK